MLKKYPGLLQLAALVILVALLPMAERLTASLTGILSLAVLLTVALILAHLGDTNRKAARRGSGSTDSKRNNHYTNIIQEGSRHVNL